MKKIRLSVLILFLLLTGKCIAYEVILEKAPVNPFDTASIKRGAKFFATTCMSCHTLIYLRYDKLAQEAGITYEKMPINVASWPYGVKPPDLSLEASVRGVDWIYTYLHSFYSDPSRPTGFNNLLFPNTAMPGIVTVFQGQQVRVNDVSQKIYDKDPQWYDLLDLNQQGSMTSEQFDSQIIDVVNFLAYAAEPYQTMQRKLGAWVIGFLLILFVLTYLLKKDYWKDIENK